MRVEEREAGSHARFAGSQVEGENPHRLRHHERRAHHREDDGEQAEERSIAGPQGGGEEVHRHVGTLVADRPGGDTDAPDDHETEDLLRPEHRSGEDIAPDDVGHVDRDGGEEERAGDEVGDADEQAPGQRHRRGGGGRLLVVGWAHGQGFPDSRRSLIQGRSANDTL